MEGSPEDDCRKKGTSLGNGVVVLRKEWEGGKLRGRAVSGDAYISEAVPPDGVLSKSSPGVPCTGPCALRP